MKKNRYKLLQKQNERSIHFKELLKFYVESGNSLERRGKNSQEMTQKTIETVIDEIYPKTPKKNYATSKADV